MIKPCKLNRSTVLVLSGLSLLLIVSLFLVPSVLAASCFTDTGGHWAETFICWMKTKGYSSGYPDGTYRPNNTISRAEVAVFMQKLISTGDIYITTGPAEWVVNANTPTGTIAYYSGFSWLGAPVNNIYRYTLSPSLPSSLYNTKLYLKGVKFCYDASEAGAYITSVEVKHFSYTTSGYGYKNTIYDYADLTDINCRALYFTTPASLNGNDQVSMDMLVTITNTTSIVRIGVTTFILSPSAEVAVLGEDGIGIGDLLNPASVDGGTR